MPSDAAPASGSPGMAAMAVYVWKSAELIGKQNDEKFWQGLQAIPINRLLLSLNSDQIELRIKLGKLLLDVLLKVGHA